jgi:alpha,alpha-trehalase
MRTLIAAILLVLCFSFVSAGYAQKIPVSENFWRLVAQEDTDHDQKITVHDQITPFKVIDEKKMTVRVVTNEYELSVLLQELKRAIDQRHGEIGLDQLNIDENIIDRTHRLIKDIYWNALTRQVDASHVDQVVHDDKTTSKCDTIYVPEDDAIAAKYFKRVAEKDAQQHRVPELRVVLLPPPDKITGSFVRNLDGGHGILSLKLELNSLGQPLAGEPYVVPGGRFNELYYWDSYFIVLGLLQDGRVDLARGMADNLLYEMNHYGIIPNANRSYYLTRSQPPFLTSIIRAVYDSGSVDREWLASALRTAMSEYWNVWLNENRRVKIGPYELSRYYDDGDGPCPEVEPGHYDDPTAPWLQKTGDPTLTPFRFINEYLYCGKYASLEVNGETLTQFFKNDRADRESGHDTTHRFDDRTTDFVSVDLNSLLYKYETDFAELIDHEFGGTLPGVSNGYNHASFWRQRAAARKQAMLALMWDDKRGYFFDYDYDRQQRSAYISATGLYPLWAKMLDSHNPEERHKAGKMIAYVCLKLEKKAGLAATAEESVESARQSDVRQWDYPYGWPPHQMLAWQGCKNYGFDRDAARLAYRWLYTIAKNAQDFDGTIPEKYDVTNGSDDVFVEYGNVGTKFSYITPEGFGWMNASFEVGMQYLSPAQMNSLRQLTPVGEITEQNANDDKKLVKYPLKPSGQ